MYMYCRILRNKHSPGCPFLLLLYELDKVLITVLRLVHTVTIQKGHPGEFLFLKTFVLRGSFLHDCSTVLIGYGKTHNIVLLVLCGQEPKKKRANYR